MVVNGRPRHIQRVAEAANDLPKTNNHSQRLSSNLPEELLDVVRIRKNLPRGGRRGVNMGTQPHVRNFPARSAASREAARICGARDAVQKRRCYSIGLPHEAALHVRAQGQI